MLFSGLTLMLLRLNPYSYAVYPMVLTFFPIVSVFMELQPPKAFSPTVTVLSGIVISLRLPQFRNAHSPIVTRKMTVGVQMFKLG